MKFAQYTPNDLRPYQRTAINHALQHSENMMWLDVGLGKTIVSLSTIVELFDRLQISGVLVVATVRIIQTVWRQEAQKWSHTRWLKFSLIHGDIRKRRRALMTPANVYLINYEQLPWLAEEVMGRYLSRGYYPPFDAVIFDEVAFLKGTRVRQGRKRGAAVLQLLPYLRYRMGLTGTPASNGYKDLFGQYLCVDSGRRLGTSFDSFSRQYFAFADWGHNQLVPREGATTAIQQKIADITISMSQDDYLKLPPFVFHDVWIDLPPKLRKAYDKIEREMMVELESGHQVEVFSAASLSNRCLQYAAGAIYKVPGEPEFEAIHQLKLDALGELVEEAAGEPVLVAYQFRHDAERILADKRFKDFRWFSAEMSDKEANQLIDDWVAGRIRGIVGHPGSVGHGIDRLQLGGRIVIWFGLPWRYDYYMQTMGRLRRSGQTKTVFVPRILMRDTVDEAVDLALSRKESDEHSVRRAIADYWREKHEKVIG